MPAIRLMLSTGLAVLVACGNRASPGSPTGRPPAGQTVNVEVRPARVSLLPGETVDFSSVVTGTADPAVSWDVAEKGGGTVSATGTYVAPLAVGEYTVRASSQVSPSAGGSAKVKVGHVAVAVSPTTATVPAGGVVAFAATVRGTKNNSVTWSLGEPSGCGSIEPSGLYTAPSAAATCHVIAASVVDPSAVAEATATASPPAQPSPVVVVVSPASGAVDACGTLAFAASVSGTADGAVTWTVQEGTAGGTITPGGIYTAPASAGTYHVVATSSAVPTSSTAAAVAVADRILGVVVSPANLAVAPGASAQFTATVTTSCGTFSSTNTLTAPN